MMEKYSVDKKEDSFEKKAECIVKTGNAKNIKDARESVAKKQENKEQ